MRAVVVDQFRVVPSVRDVPEPSCPADGVVLRVTATGVCRSDWHAWRGHDADVFLPQIPGHELAGVIVSVGPRVTRWVVGDEVTVPFVCACGTCAACLAGEQQVCERQRQPGFTDDGSYAELVALHHADVNLVRLPVGMSPVIAAGLGCRFATAYRALTVHGRVAAGDWVAVHGCGGVGLSAVLIAVAAGAKVIATDVSEPAREAARAMGASIVLDARDGPAQVAARIHATTGGGAAVSIDALGSTETATASILSLRRRGRHVQVGLMLGDAASPRLPLGRVIAWELELYGSHGMAAHEYPEMLARIASGALDPSRLVGRTIGLDEAPAALAALGTGTAGVGMTVIVP